MPPKKRKSKKKRKLEEEKEILDAQLEQFKNPDVKFVGFLQNFAHIEKKQRDEAQNERQLAAVKEE